MKYWIEESGGSEGSWNFWNSPLCEDLQQFKYCNFLNHTYRNHINILLSVKEQPYCRKTGKIYFNRVGKQRFKWMFEGSKWHWTMDYWIKVSTFQKTTTTTMSYNDDDDNDSTDRPVLGCLVDLKEAREVLSACWVEATSIASSS